MINEVFNLKKNWKLWVLISSCIFIFATFLVFLSFKDLRSLLFPPERSFSTDNIFSSIKNEFHKSASEYPMIVGDKVVTWEELDQVLNFELLFWEAKPREWQVKGLMNQEAYEKQEIISLLLDRKIVEQITQDYKISPPTEDEIEAAKIASFGDSYKQISFSAHPDMEARAETRALKDKIDEELVKRYSGILILVKFIGVGASELKSQGIDPKLLAREKIDGLYRSAEEGVSSAVLADLSRKDPEITKLNDKKLLETFANFAPEDFSIHSLEISDILKTMLANQLSEVFELTAISDPVSKQTESYAYGFFKIDEISGSSEGLETLIQKTKDNLKIEININ